MLEVLSAMIKFQSTVSERLVAFETTLSTTVSTISAFEKRVETELTVMKSKLNQLVAKQDQIVMKQDQIQCTLHNDVVTPPLTSPTLMSNVCLSRVASCTATRHEPSITPVYSIPQTSCTDVSSGLGDVDLDTLLQDWDFGGGLFSAQESGTFENTGVQEPTSSSKPCEQPRDNSGMYGRSLYPKQEDGNHPAIHSHSTAFHRKENLSLTDVFLYQHDRASSKQKPSFQQHVDGNNPAIDFASGDTQLHQQRGDGNRSTANQQKPSFQQHVDGNNPAIDFASGDTQLHQQRGDGNRSTANQQKPSSLIRPQHKDKDMGGVVALGTYQPDYSLDSDIRRGREITRAHVECHSIEKMGKIIICLARQVFFNDEILRTSTVFGKRNFRPLESNRLNVLLTIVHEEIFRNVSPSDFNENIRPRIISILSSLCRRLR
jgi:hypothetical protein